jgi:hypothetical protein
MTIVFDRSARSFDIDGRMRVEKAIISKACVNPYWGAEIPNYKELGLDPAKKYMLYRDPAELEAAAPTYEGIPLLLIHKAVSANEPEQRLVVGAVSNVKYEHPYLTASLSVWTKEAIDLIESGDKEQLSCGYRFTCDLTPGSKDGLQWDAVMRGLVGNHLALVDEARVGPEAIVPDSVPSEPPMKSKYAARFPKLTFANDADVIAFDAAMDEEKKEAEDAAREAAEDKAHDCYGKTADEWEKMEAKDKKSARDEWKKAEDKKAKDAKAAKDATPAEPADDPKNKGMDGKLTKAEVEALLANDRKEQRASIMTAVNDLAEARKAVEPLVGVIALDSAEAVYVYALGKNKIDGTGWPLAALKANVESLKSRAAPAKAKIVGDSVGGSALLAAFPGLARFQ